MMAPDRRPVLPGLPTGASCAGCVFWRPVGAGDFGPCCAGDAVELVQRDGSCSQWHGLRTLFASTAARLVSA